jgi:hypothetical protein
MTPSLPSMAGGSMSPVRTVPEPSSSLGMSRVDPA